MNRGQSFGRGGWRLSGPGTASQTMFVPPRYLRGSPPYRLEFPASFPTLAATVGNMQASKSGVAGFKFRRLAQNPLATSASTRASKPDRFLPRGKSWYTAAVGSCSLRSFARSWTGIRTSIGSRFLAGRDRSERYRALDTCSSPRLDKARAKSVRTSVEVPSESFRYRAIFASRRSRLSNQ